MSQQLGVLCVALVACGSPSSPAKPPASPSSSRARQQQSERDERVRRDELAAAHRKLEEAQQEALAATCHEPEPRAKHERCLPSCYPTEPADPRAGKQLVGATELAHLVCEKPGVAGSYVIADEIDGAKLAVRAVRGRFPVPHKQGTWQAAVEGTLAKSQRPKLPRGDVIVVTGTWRVLAHPLTNERLRCVAISHYAKAMHRALDGCGSDGTLACEATGNAAARAINVVHYRLAEARQLQAAGKLAECRQAAVEAVAVARGLPRWRQYVTLNIAQWVDHRGYRTRFDGILDEDALFATVSSLGRDAEAVAAACGAPAGAPTTVAQEQSFHTCW